MNLWKVSGEDVWSVQFFSAFWFEMPDFRQSDPWVFLEHFIHTSVAKKLLRPEPQLLRGCMDNLILNAYKNAYKLISLWGQYSQTIANAGGSAVAPTPDHLIKNPFPHSNLVILVIIP